MSIPERYLALRDSYYEAHGYTPDGIEVAIWGIEQGERQERDLSMGMRVELQACEVVLAEMLSANLLDMEGYGCLESIRMTLEKENRKAADELEEKV